MRQPNNVLCNKDHIDCHGIIILKTSEKNSFVIRSQIYVAKLMSTLGDRTAVVIVLMENTQTKCQLSNRSLRKSLE